MRTIRYYVINKSTGKAIFTHCSERACKAYLESLQGAENYGIGYKWLSI